MGSFALLRAIDITNPLTPFEVGKLEGGGANVVKVMGDLGYLGTSKGLHVLDMSDPSLPAQIGVIDLPSTMLDIEIIDGLAYVAAHLAGLRIVDVSNPNQMREIGFLETEIRSSSTSVEVRGDIAYLTAGERLWVIDVSDPTIPAIIGSSFKRRSTAEGLAVSGDLAYVADRGGIRIIDVSNPERPKLLSDTPSPGRTVDVNVIGKLAYVSGEYDGVRVVDVSDPSTPHEIGAIDLDVHTTQIVDVEVRDGLVYAADEGASFLHIFEFGPEYKTTINVEIDIMPGSDSNPINLSIGGNIPVMIVGAEGFDVTDVDETTLAFGRSGAPFDHSQGPHFEDLNGDGFTDLTSHFRIEETGIAFGDRIACLSGETLDGTPFTGCDAVRTVPDMDGDGLLDVEEEAIGTNALRSDTDGDGFEDGQEVLLMGTDPLDPLDPTPVRERKRKGKRRR